MSGEFDLIRRYFLPLATSPGALGLGDDAALLAADAGDELVITTDTIVETVHFLADDPADSVGGKLLGVNLSDLAAMGAEPVAYVLSVALPQDWPMERREAWLAAFARGLAAMQPMFRLGLLGGDTVATPRHPCLTATAFGTLPAGSALRRSGALEGDLVFVSGTIGDAALGLRLLVEGTPPELPADALPADAVAALVDRYRWPRPRVALGRRLRPLANAAADVSDGLVADLGHICQASGVGAEIDARTVPLSPAARRWLAHTSTLLPLILTGGDDYELVFTAPEAMRDVIERAAIEADVAVTCIGTITSAKAAGEAAVRVHADGDDLAVGSGGFEHFSRCCGK